MQIETKVMTRKDRKKHNRRVIIQIAKICKSGRFHAPSYQCVIDHLNNNGWRTADQRIFTRRSLYRMLQRNGISGLWGLRKSFY